MNLRIIVLTALLGGRLLGQEPAPSFKAPDRGLYEEGRYVFERNCLICHGARGDGKGEMSPDLIPQPRSFREGLFKYRSTPWGKLPTDADLKHTISGGLTGTAMGMFNILREEELSAVVEYLKFFSRHWRKAEFYAPPLVLPDRPDWMDDDAGLKAHASLGQATFEQICAACHGALGDGKGAAAPFFRDDWGFASVPADLRQPHLRCGDDATDIYRVLMTGLNGTPMVSFAGLLNDSQRWDVIAYIWTLRKAGVQEPK